MPQPPQPMTDDARRAVEGLLRPRRDDDGPGESYEIQDAVAKAPLTSANVAELVAKTVELVENEHLVFPDSKGLIEQAVVALIAGHLVLHGPPGTGKTRLACLLAEAFDCDVHTETGTPDWSTFDVVGGLRPSRDDKGAEVLIPWLGHVPRAALRCAKVVDQNLKTNSGPQAHWLTIDELSRADIDKAVGPLYTALGANSVDQRKIGLWFEDATNRSEVTLPERFRIIGTMNDVDTAFVTQLSQGLQRRFDFVHVDVPAADQVEEELEQLARQAAQWYGGLYGEVESDAVDDYADAFLEEPRVVQVLALLKGLVSFLRWEPAPNGPQWPLGSAQVGEVMRATAIYAYGDSSLTDLTEVVDRALSSSVFKQASALTEEQLEAVATYLEGRSLPRSLRSISLVREPQLTHLD